MLLVDVDKVTAGLLFIGEGAMDKLLLGNRNPDAVLCAAVLVGFVTAVGVTVVCPMGFPPKLGCKPDDEVLVTVACWVADVASDKPPEVIPGAVELNKEDGTVVTDFPSEIPPVFVVVLPDTNGDTMGLFTEVLNVVKVVKDTLLVFASALLVLTVTAVDVTVLTLVVAAP